MDDEAAWRGMLQAHLREKVLPLLDQHSPLLSELIEQYLQERTCTQCTGLPTECELLTLDTLTKLASSLRAEVICGCGYNQSSTPPDGGGGLNKLPMILVGVVKSEGCGLCLVDTTGQVDCEISSALASLNLIGHLVVLVQWSWIFTGRGGYIEVDKLQSFSVLQTSLADCSLVTAPQTSLADCSLVTVAQLKCSSKHRQLSGRRPLSVQGRVRAVSHNFRCGRTECWLAELEDPLHSHVTCCILSQVLSLMHVSRLLTVAEVYDFTNLKDKVLNKGLQNEYRLLVTTPTTQVLVSSVEGQPPCKKARGLDNTNIFDCSSLELSQFTQGESLGTEENQLVSYTGMITTCVLSDVGVYVLDGVIRLYLTHQTPTHRCKGLRNGTRVELTNAHVLRLEEPDLKHLCGLYCCTRSTVRVAQFSPLDPPSSQTDPKLCLLLQQYTVLHSAWLTDVYLHFKNKHFNNQSCYHLLKTACKALSLPPIKRDQLSEFLSHPHSCQLAKSADMTFVPSFPSLKQLVRDMTTTVTASEFDWSVGSCLDDPMGSPPVYALDFRWSYGVVKQSDLGQLQYLVGKLRSDNSTGHIELVDTSKHLSVVAAHSLTPSTPPTSHNEVLRGVGGTVLITSFEVVAEKTQRSGKEDDIKLYMYIKDMIMAVPPKNCTTVSCRKLGTQGLSSTVCSEDQQLSEVKSPTAVEPPHDQPSSDSCSASVAADRPLSSSDQQASSKDQAPSNEDRPSSLLVEIVNKNQPNGHPPSFSALANIYSNKVRIVLNFQPLSFHWHSLIHNGCVYKLSAEGPLPAMSQLLKDHSMEITRHVMISYVGIGQCTGVEDVTQLVSRLHLPAIPTLADKRSKVTARPDHPLVSVRGRVSGRGNRIDHTSLPHTLTPSLLTVAFTVQSLSRPDTIMIYCKDVCLQTFTLGLVPGCEATFHSFYLNMSRSGNIYCTSNASSSISVHSLEGVDSYGITGAPKNAVTGSMASLPSTLLYSLTMRLLSGCLSRSVVCVRGRVMSVQRISLQYKCVSCQCVLVNGQCMVACLCRRPLLVMDGRLVFDDGSAEAHVYVEDDLLRQLLFVPHSQWRILCTLVRGIGTVTYNKPSAAVKQTAAIDSASHYYPSPLTEAQNMLCDIATSSLLQRAIKLYCQPFVSQAELEEYTLGQNTRAIYLTNQRYSSLSLPRLQLRAIACEALEGLCCVGECKRAFRTEHDHDIQ